MQTITATDILRKPSLLNSKEILILEDGRKHTPKSVILPFEMYETIREQLEIEDRQRKLEKISAAQESDEFLEVGIDDGIE